jgi:hypothetical protein
MTPRDPKQRKECSFIVWKERVNSINLQRNACSDGWLESSGDLKEPRKERVKV